MTNNSRYYPPAIRLNWLVAEILAQYPAHKDSPDLIISLAQEYLKFWRLVLTYPEMRIVAPSPLIAVQRIHWKHRDQYFNDCMDYFRKYLFKELVWRGRLDVVGTFQTVRSYYDLYDTYPPEAWVDMNNEYNLGRSHLRLI
jgi:hypothetical protein